MTTRPSNRWPNQDQFLLLAPTTLANEHHGMTKAVISNPGSVPTHEKTSRELLLLLGFLIAAPVGIRAQSPSEPATAAFPSVTLAASTLIPKSVDGERRAESLTFRPYEAKLLRLMLR